MGFEHVTLQQQFDVRAIELTISKFYRYHFLWIPNDDQKYRKTFFLSENRKLVRNNLGESKSV